MKGLILINRQAICRRKSRLLSRFGNRQIFSRRALFQHLEFRDCAAENWLTLWSYGNCFSTTSIQDFSKICKIIFRRPLALRSSKANWFFTIHHCTTLQCFGVLYFCIKVRQINVPDQLFVFALFTQCFEHYNLLTKKHVPLQQKSVTEFCLTHIFNCCKFGRVTFFAPLFL